MEGDGLANFAYYCLHKLRITPRQFEEMDTQEKAFIIASIQIRTENEKKEAKKAKSKRRK